MTKAQLFPSHGASQVRTISLGTGRSGIVSEDWSIAGELGEEAGLDGDHASEEGEPPSVGAFEIPEGLVVGENAEEDARWFRRTEGGVVLITRKMIEARAAAKG